MALQKITDIEGLDAAYENVPLGNDTDPGATQIKFEVIAEEMPGLTAKENRLVKKNFIWIKKIINLGNLIVHRRIKDKVEFDEESKRWKVTLLHKTQSDIMRYKAEWNLFARGTTGAVTGTPLSVIFPHDPAKCDMYKYFHVSTAEQLSKLTGSHLEQLPMGSRGDVEAAKAFLAQSREGAPAIELNYLLEQKNKEIELLNARLSDMASKVDMIIAAKDEEKYTHRPSKKKSKKGFRRGPRPVTQVEEADNTPIEGLEG